MERLKLSVSPVFQAGLKQQLMRELGSCQEKKEQYCLYRLDFTAPTRAVIKQFTNGTFYVEAADSRFLSRISTIVANATGSKVARPVTPVETNAPIIEQGKIEMFVPYIGTDESGKGDYFGPLVIAGVYTTPEQADTMRKLGVQDSKLLKDKPITELAAAIQNLVGESGYDIITLLPDRYNALYESHQREGKNLNHMLAWGHAQVIEHLLEKNPDCLHAIADQFGNAQYIQNQLQTRGKAIQLYQTPKAEANVGVAAASILARAQFVAEMKTLSAQFHTILPFGAGSPVLAEGKSLVAQYGASILNQVAKRHFKTTSQLIS